MIRLSIGRPVAITMAYMTIAALGIASWKNIPIELLPDSSLPQLTVSATYDGGSPEVVEAFVTSPLESALQQVRGVEKITSSSSEGSARITVEFAIDTDMEFARLEMSEYVARARADLPSSVRTTIEQYVPDEFQESRLPLLRYTMTGPYMLEYLKRYADESLVPALSQIEGVGQVIAQGGRRAILEVRLDEERIRSLGLSPSLVSSRIRQLEIVREAGAIYTENGRLRTIAIRERAETPEDVLALPVLYENGRVVRVADVGRVLPTFEDPQNYYRIDGFPAVSLYVFRAPRSNAVATADALKAALAGLDMSHPSGVRLILDDDQSEDIRNQLSDLRNRALISAVIVLLVLLAFLRSARAAIVVFATVAFSVLITINVMYFAGFTLNLLTLMGLAMGFGLVVDNAIVVLENTYRRRKDGDAPLEAARRGAGDVVIPILAATGTTLVVLVPFVYLQGELRIFYVPLALVVGIALAASLFVAFTFIPSLAARLLGAIKPIPRDDESPEHQPTNPTVAAIPHALRKSLPVRGYASLIRLSLRRPWVTVVLSVLMLGGSWYLFDRYVSRNRIWNFGGETRDRITINISQPRGEELARTDELARFFESRLRRMPEVEQFVSQISARRGTITVYFPDSLQYTGIPPAIKEQMVQHSLLFGGTDVRVYGYGPSFYGGGGGSSPNYTVKVLGYNYEQVRLIAEDIGRRLERFSRIREVDTNSSGRFTRDKATEIVVDIDRARIGLYDLTSQEVVSYVSSAVRGRGQQLGGGGETVRVGGEEMDLSVKLADSRSMDVMGLEDLLMPTATSREGVRLRDVATITEREVLNEVVRENQQYQRNVSYEFRGPAKLGDVVLESVLGSLALPPGYSVDRGQLWSWSVEEARQIWGVIAIAIVLIFMVTAAVFESIKQPFCVLLTVPMALIGVFLIFFYTGASFTREAYVGVIMMSGIVVNGAILLVDHVNQLRRRDGMSLEDGLIRGTIERVRPILMTGLTTICGLLPLVLFSQSADANIWNALAYVVIGGLASSTILVLTVTPALYKIFERRAEAKRLEAVAATPDLAKAAAPA